MEQARSHPPKIGLAVCTLMKDVFNDFTPTRADGQAKAKQAADVLGRLWVPAADEMFGKYGASARGLR